MRSAHEFGAAAKAAAADSDPEMEYRYLNLAVQFDAIAGVLSRLAVMFGRALEDDTTLTEEYKRDMLDMLYDQRSYRS